MGRNPGCPLLNWTSESAAVLPDLEAKKPKHTLLPVLVVLFLISYGLLSMLVMEQARTIEGQRSLIRALFDDSSQLSHMKSQAMQKQRAEAQAQAEAKTHPQAKTPSTPDKPHDQVKSEHSTGKVRKQLPEKPPKDSADDGDERRTVITI